jgi:hypothetical protein
MFKFHKCIDDSDRHFGAYLSFLCSKITIDYYRSSRPFQKMVYARKPIKKISYDCSDGFKLRFQYVNKPIQPLPLHKEIELKPIKEKSNMLTSKTNYLYNCGIPRYSYNMNNYLKNRIGKLNDYAIELNQRLPIGQKIMLGLNYSHPKNLYIKDDKAEMIIHNLKARIRYAEKKLKIQSQVIGGFSAPDFVPEYKKTAPVPSAPPYVPANICNNASAMFAPKKTTIKRPRKIQKDNQYGKYVNVNVNINIGKINCRIF